MATVRVDGRTVRVKIHPIARPVVLPIRPQTTRVIMRNSNVGTEGAAPTVDSVNGQQGTVVLTKSDVGLGNVDNTSDANKPISTATQTALDGKASTGYVDNAVAGIVNSAPAVLNTLGELAVALGNDPNFATTIAGQIGGKANAVHTHAIADTTGLQTALDSKAPQSTTYTKTEVDTALSGKAATSHTHTKAQVTDFAHTHPVAEVTGLGTAATKDVASSGDATAGQVVQGNDSRLSDSRTPTAHSHAQADVTGLVAALAGKAAVAHAHAIADVTGLQTALDAKQDSDPTLAALAAHNTNGILTQTAADTFTGRTITGTTNQITVTNGNGVSGNPTLALPQDIHTGAAPQFIGLNIYSTIAAAALVSQSANDWSSGLHVRKRGATGDANAAVANGAEIGYHTFSGWDGTTYKRLAYVITRANGAITPTTGGGIYKINVRGADGVEGDRFSLDSVAMSLAVNSNPHTDSTYTLGTSSLYWKETSTDKLFLNSTATLDGSTAGKAALTGRLSIEGADYISGTGFPNGVVSAPVGSIYIDKAITNGASSWIKKSGTGNTGWQVLGGDTGWRDISSLLVNGWTASKVQLKRSTTGGVSVRANSVNGVSATSTLFVNPLPAGFRISTVPEAFTTIEEATNTPFFGLVGTSGQIYTNQTRGVAKNIYLKTTFETQDAWPSTLPGTPA